MRFLKFIFSLIVASSIMAGGYYLLWNFIASKQLGNVLYTLNNNQQLNFEYDTVTISGFPYDINVSIKNLEANTKLPEGNLKYIIGDVDLVIHPFTLTQQAGIVLPTQHKIVLDRDGKESEYLIESDTIDLSILDNNINFHFKDFKMYRLSDNKKLVHADKLLYKAYTDNNKSFRFSASNIVTENNSIDSLLFNINLKNALPTDIFGFVINLLMLNDKKLSTKYVDMYLNKFLLNNTLLHIENMKYVNNDDWLEVELKTKLDERKRLIGNLELVSNNVMISENITQLISGNDKLELSKNKLIAKLIEKNNNNLIRVSAKLDKGGFYISNERLERVKPILKELILRSK